MANTRTQFDNGVATPVTSRAPTAAAGTGTGARTLDMIALILMIIGGLNWGLVGLFQFDLVAAIFGPMSAPARVVYVVVGLAALVGIMTAVRVAQRRA